MTPEASAKKKIQNGLAALRKEGLRSKLVWNAGTTYGAARLDCDGVVEGRFVAIEVKRFDGKGALTQRQIVDMKEYEAAGGFAFVIDSESSMHKFFEWCRERKAAREWSETMNRAAAMTHYGD